MTASQFLGAVEAYVDQGLLSIDLPEPVVCRHTKAAQAVLDGAYASVYNTWLSMRRSRGYEKISEDASLRGRLAAWDVDLLRASIVFAGAGLDATIKTLIRGCLTEICRVSSAADLEFTNYVAKQIADPDRLAPLLVHQAGDIRSLLLEDYSTHLTGDSLQSVSQLRKASKALGIESAGWVRERLDRNSKLQEVFVARNTIVHEMDVTPNDRWSRRYRNLQETEEILSESLVVAQLFINSVGDLLNS